MGIMDHIVETNEDYIQLVDKYIKNEELKMSCEEEIKKNKHKLFEEEKSVEEWELVLKYINDT
jgi:hypothetical protein